MTQTRESEPSARSAGRGGKRPSYPQRIANYNRQVVAEMRKVLWPTRNELVTYTIVSVTFVVAMIAFIAVCDYVFTKFVFEVFG